MYDGEGQKQGYEWTGARLRVTRADEHKDVRSACHSWTCSNAKPLFGNVIVVGNSRRCCFIHGMTVSWLIEPVRSHSVMPKTVQLCVGALSSCTTHV